MAERFDTTIRIDSEHGEITVEQKMKGGVMARKNITPQALIDTLVGSRYDDAYYATGLLPDGCVAAVMGQDTVTYASPNSIPMTGSHRAESATMASWRKMVLLAISVMA